MQRISLKVTGAQGQGVNSVGEMCAKGLKRAGYCVFGYREYMSLIKGGHSSFQLDISNEKVESTETKVDVLVCFNHHGLEQNALDVKKGGVILHQTPQWKFSPAIQKQLDAAKISVVHMPNEKFLKDLKAPPILGNVLITAVVWAILGRKADELKALVKEQFGHKGEKLLAMNYAAIDVATKWVITDHPTSPSGLRGAGQSSVSLPAPNKQWQDHLLLTGSQAMGMGMVHAGCRMYVGYPMTPSSPLLEYMADTQNETGLVIKQAEDEITAAQMMSGAMHMGTRAATGTSGGGFDLMTETVSLNGIIENPSVFVLAQRPGPATGLPTWTAQGDLLLAVGSAHGEFARLVVSVSDGKDSFDLMPEAFNYAEKFQTPVIILTDKQIAEAIYTQKPYDQKKAKVHRGLLVTDPQKLAKLKSGDRYDPKAKDGISLRWLPGAKAATYCAQGDEHNASGDVDESSKNAVEQMEKRMKKMEALKKALPEPEVLGLGGRALGVGKELDVLIVSWGSNKSVILDALQELKAHSPKLKAAYLHYTYLWPLKTDELQKAASKAKKVILVEGNHNAQLGSLITQTCGMRFRETILKYDGRPFFVDELVALLKSRI
ncbi:2-oxoacid:acceptor oxidoreductase subunit alpha [Candidatus Peregrinibacteria bacterium]|nr:2-oxoacid:acceptor oxidoreductase subunit alpha [Candidatus Peregrinibacteria bacterium]